MKKKMGQVIKFPGHNKIIPFPSKLPEKKYYEKYSEPEDNPSERLLVGLGTSLLIIAMVCMFYYMTWFIM